MGRNYELLTEFESDLEPAESCHANAVADATSRAVVPPAWAGRDSGDEEMQHLVRRVFLSTGETPPARSSSLGLNWPQLGPLFLWPKDLNRSCFNCVAYLTTS